MRNILLAAAAVTALATPALARDGQPYVGIEAGVVLPEDLQFDIEIDDGTDQVTIDDAFTVDFKKGLDLDAIAGYDFGVVRVEGELGYKRFRTDAVTFSPQSGLGDEDFDDNSRASVLSLMGNAMLDFTNEQGLSGYIGGGLGRARVRLGGEADSAFAWQVIAGVRQAVTDSIDVGLKYRYFHTGDLDFNDDFVSATGELRTHSLLASLIFNFGAPAPAPVIVAPVAAPPPPPATQTCPDGSVILATDVCPPPPAPAPVPTPERG